MAGSFPGDPTTRQSDDDVVSRVDLPDGRALAFRGAGVVGFNLFQAQRHGRRGARERRQAVGDLYLRYDGMWGISDPSKELDLMSDLATAVLFSYTALEGLGNLTIKQMEEDATVEVERDGETIAVSRDVMERTLSVSEKLSVVVPAFTKKPSIRGGVLWGKLVRLCGLRDGLVQPIDRGSNAGIFGLLLRGDADTCAEDAIALVSSLRPELLPSALLWAPTDDVAPPGPEDSRG